MHRQGNGEDFHGNIMIWMAGIINLNETISYMKYAKFLIQRPEYPDWWAGWNEHDLPSWTSHQDCARPVRLDELADTLTRLKKHKPIAVLSQKPRSHGNCCDCGVQLEQEGIPAGIDGDLCDACEVRWQGKYGAGRSSHTDLAQAPAGAEPNKHTK